MKNHISYNCIYRNAQNKLWGKIGRDGMGFFLGNENFQNSCILCEYTKKPLKCTLSMGEMYAVWIMSQQRW